MYENMGISKELENLAKKTQDEIKEQFKQIDEICEINSVKVLEAMQESGLSTSHFKK